MQTDSSIEQAFNSLTLDAPILRAVEKQGYTHMTPIQLQAIPKLLEGRDLLGTAQTGTGKTAAFVLPLLQQLRSGKKQPAPQHPQSGNSRKHHRAPVARPQALILAPTRELAIQIDDSVSRYGEDSRLGHTVLFHPAGAPPETQADRVARTHGEVRRGLAALGPRAGRTQQEDPL